MPRGQVPRRIKKSGTGFKGLSMREVFIVVAGLALAILLVMALSEAPLWIKAGLAVLVAGVALALAFGTHRGQKIEELIARWIAHRTRNRRMVWRRGGDEIPDVEIEEPRPGPGPTPTRKRAPAPASVTGPGTTGGEDWVNLWWALVNAIMLAAMTSLTVYLADGGAEELRLWWQYKLR